ncbi:hypothetical protein [Rhizobium leguminosarum]|uniref:hypothetical protein n=1 Tax=Rhizobium leguminosarum TaxID=384 RepID=UPI003F95D427
MSDLVNFIQFNNDKLTGNIATLSFDIHLTGEALTSENPKTLVFRLIGQAPRHRPIEVGTISERDLRGLVIKRKISGGMVSRDGRQARDSMLRLMKA